MNHLDTVPRRNKLYELTSAELCLYNAAQEIEEMGADPELTDIIVKLGALRNELADFVDSKII